MAIAANKKLKHASARKRAGAAQKRSSAGTRRATAGKPRGTKGGPNPSPPERSAPAMAEIDAEALEFIEAIDRFKRQHGRPFPSWSEVLMVLRELGYRRD